MSANEQPALPLPFVVQLNGISVALPTTIQSESARISKELNYYFAALLLCLIVILLICCITTLFNCSFVVILFYAILFLEDCEC